MKKQMTLCLIHEPSRILLGMKKRGFGAGRWNGFGGKVQETESVEQAALRELEEESGVTAARLEKRGIIDFVFEKAPDETLEVYIFKVEDYSGEPSESEEMLPKWHALDSIPFESMWPDDIHWFPLFLAGKRFRGRFLFGENDAILEKELGEVVDFD